MTSIVAIFLLSVLFASIKAFEFGPSDKRGKLACFQTLDEESRTSLVNSFNNIRSQIAKGKFVAYDGKLAPPGKNINKVKYDYTLEAILQVLIANPYYDRIIPSYARVRGASFVDVSVVKALTLAPPEMYLSFYTQNGTGVYGGTEFAFGDATSVACAYRAYANDYPNGVSIICAVAPVTTEDLTNKPIYMAGAACTKNSECTKPGFNKCDVSLGLCYP